MGSLPRLQGSGCPPPQADTGSLLTPQCPHGAWPLQVSSAPPGGVTPAAFLTQRLGSAM